MLPKDMNLKKGDWITRRHSSIARRVIESVAGGLGIEFLDFGYMPIEKLPEHDWQLLLPQGIQFGREHGASQLTASTAREAEKQKRIEELEAELLGIRGIQFSPTGDNHHNANLCPYCNPSRYSSPNSGDSNE